MAERKKIFLIFPTQLFKDTEPLKEADQIYLIEEPTYFTKYKFHIKFNHFLTGLSIHL
jgi:hypothetical protein